MKNLVFIFLLIVFNNQAFSYTLYQINQELLPNEDTIKSELLATDGLRKGFKATVNTGYSFGVGEIEGNRWKLHALVGYQMNSYLSIGIGSGVHFQTDYNKLPQYITPDDEGTTVPLFLNIFTSFKQGKVAPYFSLDFGGTFEFKSEWVEPIGYLVNPEIGVSVRISKKLLLNTGIGYDIEQALFREDDNYHVREIVRNIQSVRFSVGITYN